ncbi:hypothetical protein CPB83DRAFT_837387 [Crepidotus variabilis]|uniref:Uncharacterized protein n=1 Tax=Crepidotus variabilis TaxID=179855 RepID=A0A9P6JN51_9AGAR|nr:hypothetical protein CPB83DRAFT_837387 [Crepidotus variabilis]
MGLLNKLLKRQKYESLFLCTGSSSASYAVAFAQLVSTAKLQTRNSFEQILRGWTPRRTRSPGCSQSTPVRRACLEKYRRSLGLENVALVYRLQIDRAAKILFGT